jgi:hypothetical protein
MEFDNRGRVSLWKNTKEGDRQPYVDGNLVAHRDIKEGETIRMALWVQKGAASNQPVLKGQISDPLQHNAENTSELQSNVSEEDIPF